MLVTHLGLKRLVVKWPQVGIPTTDAVCACVATTPSTYGQASAMPSIVGCSALGADDSGDDDAIAGDTQRW